MSFLDQMMGHLNGVDLGAIAGRVGLPPDQVQSVIAALGQQHDQPGDTAEGAAAQTGLPLDQVRQVLEHVGGEGVLAKLSGALGSAGGEGGLGSMLSGFFAKQ